MTETEELRQNTEHQKAHQTMMEVHDYLDEIVVRLKVAYKKEKEALIVYTAVWVLWVVAGFISAELNAFMQLAFLVALMYHAFRTAQRSRISGEFHGALKVLEILGMIPPIEKSGDT